jgi:hypothetical protein
MLPISCSPNSNIPLSFVLAPLPTSPSPQTRSPYPWPACRLILPSTQLLRKRGRTSLGTRKHMIRRTSHRLPRITSSILNHTPLTRRRRPCDVSLIKYPGTLIVSAQRIKWSSMSNTHPEVIAFIELAERFSFYGSSVVFVRSSTSKAHTQRSSLSNRPTLSNSPSRRARTRAQAGATASLGPLASASAPPPVLAPSTSSGAT